MQCPPLLPFSTGPAQLPNNLISILLLFCFKLSLNHPQMCVGILGESKRNDGEYLCNKQNRPMMSLQ